MWTVIKVNVKSEDFISDLIETSNNSPVKIFKQKYF